MNKYSRTVAFRNSLICVWLLLLISQSAASDDRLRQRIEGWSAGYPQTVLGEALRNTKRLPVLYEQHDFKLLWFDDDRLNPRAQQWLAALAGVEADGLFSADYHWSLLQQLQPPQTQADAWQYDLVLSDALISLADHLVSGKVDPESITSEWKANKRKIGVDALDADLLGNAPVDDVLNRWRPNQIRYFRLRDALAKLDKLDSEGWAPLAEKPAIKPGMTDERLAEIGRRLLLWGDLPAAADTSSYETELVTAIKHFQLRHGLEVDGVIGAESIRALNVSPQQRRDQIIVNMERWRWLPEELGRYFLVVNVAAFELKVIRDNETVFTKPVIVGRNYRKTPVFSDNIRYLVLNPTWTVPRKLAVQDKLPEIQRNPEYLSHLGFTLYELGTNTVVNPQKVSWLDVTKANFPYRLVQGPGPQNALGQVKFMFPNPYDVYLHDTPSRDLFGKSERAFSSGCIRVAEPLDLAEFLLADTQWSRQRIDDLINAGNTETIYLATPLPIHIEYWTAWVDRAGTLNFRKDIYDRDAPLWKALTTPASKLDG